MFASSFLAMVSAIVSIFSSSSFGPSISLRDSLLEDSGLSQVVNEEDLVNLSNVQRGHCG
jgi:hypothetical protein